MNLEVGTLEDPDKDKCPLNMKGPGHYFEMWVTSHFNKHKNENSMPKEMILYLLYDENSSFEGYASETI